MNNHYYQYYCKTIKGMMDSAKSENRSQLLTSNGETIFVKYNEKDKFYKVHFSFIMNNMSKEINPEVVEMLGEYDPLMHHEDIITKTLDTVQIGMISMDCITENDIVVIIDHYKSNRMHMTKDTNYIFCGKKLLRVIQYFGNVTNPLEYIDVIPMWNDLSAHDKIKGKVFSQSTGGIDYNHTIEQGKVIFSFGSNKTVFEESISTTIPRIMSVENTLSVNVNE